MSENEIEVKAVVDDPAALIVRLGSGGATRAFRGRMFDRRYDLPSHPLEQRDQVLRVRTFQPAAGSRGRLAEVAWKGPTRQHLGYKEREEVQFTVDESGPVEAILGHLGLAVIDTIDRCVEFYHLGGAELRLEWYPRMDVLLEVEGTPAAIEEATAASGVPRASFTSDRLLDFAARFRRRTGQTPALNLAGLGGQQPGWPDWVLHATGVTGDADS